MPDDAAHDLSRMKFVPRLGAFIPSNPVKKAGVPCYAASERAARRPRQGAKTRPSRASGHRGGVPAAANQPIAKFAPYGLRAEENFSYRTAGRQEFLIDDRRGHPASRVPAAVITAAPAACGRRAGHARAAPGRGHHSAPSLPAVIMTPRRSPAAVTSAARQAQPTGPAQPGHRSPSPSTGMIRWPGRGAASRPGGAPAVSRAPGPPGDWRWLPGGHSHPRRTRARPGN
jgi:hypothetical protein